MPLSEADVKAKYIDPKIHDSGWSEDLLIREYPITQDRFFVEGEEYRKLNTSKFADYVLRYKEVNIALIEAKAEDEDPLKHLSQAQGYGERLDVPFLYISNGKTTFLHDRRTLKTEIVEDFLSPEEIYSAFLEWRGLGKTNVGALNYPIYSSGSMKPRAYQETAINKVIGNVLKNNQRTLLTMATGTGKTFVAFQIIWKLVKSKTFSRILFLTDRIFLKDQAYNTFEPFREGSNDPRCKIENGEFNKNRDIYFSTYQTLFANDLYKKIPTDFFDLIVIDECHRSRYGDWGIVLDHFNTACHLGMTATPKREDNIDVYEYFGEPVFEYSLGQAIEDGYLVPYKIYKITTNLYKKGLDVSNAEEVIYDDEIEPDKIKDFYEPSEFERAISVPDQIDVLSQKVAGLLDKTNPFGKTIIFCVDMTHAQQVKDKLNKLKGSEDYATRIVAEDKDDMTKFRDKEMAMPVVATTVDLLSTGIDIPHVQNIVFMRPIASRVLFKQIIGRGSRLCEDKGFFRIIDFTNATRLIDEWDIPAKLPTPQKPPEEPREPYDKLFRGLVIDDKTEEPVPQANFLVKLGRWNKRGTSDPDGIMKLFGLPSNEQLYLNIEKNGYKKLNKKFEPQKSEEEAPYEFRLKLQGATAKKIIVKGIEVTIDEEIEVEFDGIKLSYAEYRKYSQDNLKKAIHSTEDLKDIWLNQEKREWLLKQLEEKNVNLNLIKSIENLEDIDGFDIIAHLVFNAPLLTREDRTKNFFRLFSQEISQYGKEIQGAIIEILDTYKYRGEENLCAEFFRLPGMYEKKEEIQQNYPNGLAGFVSFVKNKVYETVGV